MFNNHSIHALIESATAFFNGAAHTDSAKLDAQLLLCHSLNVERSYLFTWPEKTLEKRVVDQFEQLVKQRALGQPVAYLVGQKEFWSLPLFCNETTLIPRPDTEILVEHALNFIIEFNESAQESSARILDLGTGTGAIALALASEFPKSTIDAVDVMADAVVLAKKNAQHLQLANVNVYQSYWFDQIAKHERFNVIVSNPPYIDANDQHLQEGDVTYEPLSALVAPEQGFADIDIIIKQARSYLARQGALFIEHGFEQADHVQRLFHDAGYQQVQTVRDLNNNPRVTWAIYNNNELE